TVPASPAPSVVPVPFSNPAHVDPEEAFVASIASCHMLTFLHVAMRAGVVVERYEDDAVGVMRKNERGAVWVAAVTLRPRIVYGGATRPTAEEIDRLHHQAHEQCFIANSVKTEIALSLDDGNPPSYAPRMKWWRVLLLLVAACLFSETALAYASPPDPTWTDGIYDDDGDDVIVSLPWAAWLVDLAPQAGLTPRFVAIPLAPAGKVRLLPTPARSAFLGRAPPVA